MVAEGTSDQQDIQCLEVARQAIVTVDKGRGFILGIDGYPDRVIITAAHCLPQMPPAMPAAYLEEKTYKDLLGPLDGKHTIWAECVFVDPVADIAILCGPDNQALGKEAEKYDALVDSVSPLQASLPPTSPSRGWVFGLTADRLACQFDVFMGHDEPAIPPTVSIVMESGGIIDGGMSGSPILDEAGRVVSLVSTAEGEGKRGDLQPTLTEKLPGWIVRRLGLHEGEQQHVTREKAT